MRVDQAGPSPVDTSRTRSHPPAPRWLRAVATWLVIFPSVALGQWLLAPVDVIGSVGRTAVLTALVVPMSVYAGTPLVLRAIGLVTRVLSRGGPV